MDTITPLNLESRMRDYRMMVEETERTYSLFPASETRRPGGRPTHGILRTLLGLRQLILSSLSRSHG